MATLVVLPPTGYIALHNGCRLASRKASLVSSREREHGIEQDTRALLAMNPVWTADER